MATVARRGIVLGFHLRLQGTVEEGRKQRAKLSGAVADIPDGASLMVAGFGMAGYPQELVLALRDRGAKELTIICNSCGGTREDRLDVGILIKAKRVRKAIASIGVLPGNSAPAVEEQWASGELDLVETARDTPVLGMVTGPATLARSFLGQSWEKTESGMETLSRLGEEVIALTRAFCERRIDGVVVLDPALVELPGVLFEGVVRLFRTMHNLTQFYDARLLLATSLPEKADPGFLEGLSVDGVSDGRWEGAGESRGASAPVRGIAIPPSAWGEEIEERVRAAVAETTQDRAYITTDGEVSFGTPADRLHEVMDALEG